MTVVAGNGFGLFPLMLCFGEQPIVGVDQSGSVPLLLVVHRCRWGHSVQTTPNLTCPLVPMVAVLPAGQVTLFWSWVDGQSRRG